MGSQNQEALPCTSQNHVCELAYIEGVILCSWFCRLKVDGTALQLVQAQFVSSWGIVKGFLAQYG